MNKEAILKAIEDAREHISKANDILELMALNGVKVEVNVYDTYHSGAPVPSREVYIERVYKVEEIV